MKMVDVLDHLGVGDDTLSSDERAFLDEQGYLPLEGVLSTEEAARFARRLDELAAAEGDQAGGEFSQEAGAARLSNLVDKDPMFEKCFTHPRVLAGIRQVLGDGFKLSSLNSRAALPGEGLQALHADWGEAVGPGEYQVCNSIWLLSDFTTENGATRVVPGSHRWGQLPKDVMADPKAAHPDEMVLVAPAGTVVIFNSHTWHGGTLNRTDQPRRAMHSYFCARGQKQQVDQRKFLSAATVERLSEAARVVLDAG